MSYLTKRNPNRSKGHFSKISQELQSVKKPQGRQKRNQRSYFDPYRKMNLCRHDRRSRFIHPLRSRLGHDDFLSQIILQQRLKNVSSFHESYRRSVISFDYQVRSLLSRKGYEHSLIYRVSYDSYSQKPTLNLTIAIYLPLKEIYENLKPHVYAIFDNTLTSDLQNHFVINFKGLSFFGQH
jgi:hypothetical protein